MSVLSREWWMQDVGTKQPKASPSQPVTNVTIVSVPKQKRPGKWVLRAWHALCLFALAKTLMGNTVKTSAVSGTYAYQQANDAHALGTFFGLLIIAIFWLVIAKLIQIVAASFARD